MMLLALDLGTWTMGMAMLRDGKVASSLTVMAPRGVNAIVRQALMLDTVRWQVGHWAVDEIVMERPWGKYRNLAPLVALHMGIEGWAKVQGIPCYSYPVATVRKGVARNGRVSRAVLALAVRQLFPGLPREVDEHQIDSLALAWWHHHSKEVSHEE